nr:PREDICTED: zinc finger protein 670 [Anolis carolinensis]|eukprot:XP_008118232.1 PREDICTED: zinc finger protein 670 [Anolis carolinensis]
MMLFPSPQSFLPLCDGMELNQGPIAFEDVAVQFSLEEWVLLNPDQKVLHMQIMEEIRGIVDSLGKAPAMMGISISKCSIPIRSSLAEVISEIISITEGPQGRAYVRNI